MSDGARWQVLGTDASPAGMTATCCKGQTKSITDSIEDELKDIPSVVKQPTFTLPIGVVHHIYVIFLDNCMYYLYLCTYVKFVVVGCRSLLNHTCPKPEQILLHFFLLDCSYMQTKWVTYFNIGL